MTEIGLSEVAKNAAKNPYALDRYLGDASSGFARWLLGRARSETAIALEPRTLVSWDYRERMGSAAAVLPESMPGGLTR